MPISETSPGRGAISSQVRRSLTDLFDRL